MKEIKGRRIDCVLKSMGKGYQTRINAGLRAYMAAHGK